MPSTSASAVLAEMTADAPVAATQVGAEALDPSLTIGQATGKAGAAQQAPSSPTGEGRSAVTASASASAQKEAALKQNIHVADSKAAAVSGLEAAAAAGTKVRIVGAVHNALYCRQMHSSAPVLPALRRVPAVLLPVLRPGPVLNLSTLMLLPAWLPG
jgi:hypothetical protein